MLMERAGTVEIRGPIEQTLGDCASGGNETAKRYQNSGEIKCMRWEANGVEYASRATS
jgi:hypothetical protein